MTSENQDHTEVPEKESESAMRTFKGRRRRLTICLLLFLAMAWSAHRWLQEDISHMTRLPDPPLSVEEEARIDGLLKRSKFKGANARPVLRDLIQISDLPAKCLPGTGPDGTQGRLVIVGDVHGQRNALIKLLNKVGFDKKHDHLILAGDMISKGSDSVGVVDLLMELGAFAVRGNHEDRVLLADAEMAIAQGDADSSGLVEDAGKKQMGLDSKAHGHGDSDDKALARELGQSRLHWLKERPVILKVGKFGDLGEVVVVHAGLAPGVELEKQDPMMVMNMRVIDRHGVPSSERDGMDWSKVWNKFQRKLPEKERMTIVYGHDQKRGLRLHDYSFGIDTGCIKGGKLTALVLDGSPESPQHSLVQIKCKSGR